MQVLTAYRMYLLNIVYRYGGEWQPCAADPAGMISFIIYFNKVNWFWSQNFSVGVL